MKKIILILLVLATTFIVTKANNDKTELVINKELKLVNGGDYIEVITTNVVVANQFHGDKEVLYYFSEMDKNSKQYVFIISKSNKDYLLKKLNVK